MTRIFAASMLVMVPALAHATMIDGYAALCTSVAAGTCTESTAAGYARQPVSFSLVAAAWSGEGANRALVSRAANSREFSFPYGLANGWQAPAGRAVWDAPTGGNLILVLPYGSGARTRPVDVVEPGDLVLEGAAFVASYSGQVAAGAVLGTCYDRADVVGPRTPAVGEVQGPDGFVVVKSTGIVTAGVALVLNRGFLQSASSWATL